MCFQNGEEMRLPFMEWREIFPDGIPSEFLPSNPPWEDDGIIDMKKYSPVNLLKSTGDI